MRPRRTGGGVIFAPFAVFPARETLYKLPLSLVYPIVVAAASWRLPHRPRALIAAWLFLGIAMFETLTLAEAGRVQEGNFAWTGQVAVFLAYVESTLFMLTAVRRGDLPWCVQPRRPRAGWYAAVFFPERVDYL